MTATFIFFIVEEFTSLVWTPRLGDAGVNLQTLGLLFSISALISIILPLIINKIQNNKKRNTVIVIVSLLFAILLFVAGFNISLITLALIFIIMNVLESVVVPLDDSIFASNVENTSLSATIFSMRSAIVSIASIIGAPIAGFILDKYGFRSSYLIYSIFLVIIPMVYIIYFKKKVERIN
ncbi:MAG: MFS transporter [bacterium]